MPGARAVGGRAFAHHPLEAAVEGRKIAEAAIEGDAGDRQVTAAQCDGGAMQPVAQQILVRRHAD